MSLDAVVYCDCFERGRLLTQPLAEWHAYVTRGGDRSTPIKSPAVELAFDRWDFDQACEHPRGVLLHHYLGNIARIRFFRDALSQRLSGFPILFQKVIHNGVHCGDLLEVAQVEQLLPEVGCLAQIHSADANREELLRGFEQKMHELCDCSLRVRKPIVFS